MSKATVESSPAQPSRTPPASLPVAPYSPSRKRVQSMPPRPHMISPFPYSAYALVSPARPEGRHRPSSMYGTSSMNAHSLWGDPQQLQKAEPRRPPRLLLNKPTSSTLCPVQDEDSGLRESNGPNDPAIPWTRTFVLLLDTSSGFVHDLLLEASSTVPICISAELGMSKRIRSEFSNHRGRRLADDIETVSLAQRAFQPPMDHTQTVRLQLTAAQLQSSRKLSTRLTSAPTESVVVYIYVDGRLSDTVANLASSDESSPEIAFGVASSSSSSSLSSSSASSSSSSSSSSANRESSSSSSKRKSSSTQMESSQSSSSTGGSSSSSKRSSRKKKRSGRKDRRGGGGGSGSTASASNGTRRVAATNGKSIRIVVTK
mmetsp:Transcript_38075/g.95779  ORF Transcript_38075/g.95779 Transcript_38075/m.95779 type:complete len:373 (-) Transcript_38075:35-1153(-)